MKSRRGVKILKAVSESRHSHIHAQWKKRSSAHARHTKHCEEKRSAFVMFRVMRVDRLPLF